MDAQFQLNDFTSVAQRERGIESLLLQHADRVVIDASQLKTRAAASEYRQVELFFKLMIERMRRDEYPIPHIEIILPQDRPASFTRLVLEMGRISNVDFEIIPNGNQ